jgi:deoxyribodipyrimidine photolyase-related protein
MNIFIILPTQLFKNIKILKKYDLIYLIEEPYYLNPNYHKQKLLLHISSLNYYKDYLIKNDINVKYLHFNQINYNSIFNNNNNYKMYNPIDKQMIKLFNKYNVEYLDSPMFLNTYEDLLNYKNSKNKNNYNQSDFYKNQRIKYNILIDKNNKPLYNKWSFDTENRQKFPKNYIENKIAQYNNKYLEYATKYINENFPNSFGIINNYYYPCTHNNAIKHLKHFMNNKIKYFGNFQTILCDIPFTKKLI